MFVAFDDTDSRRGMCTTYLCALLCEKLGVKKYPKLIRLNPNIPFKTRGNGAVAFEAEGDYEEIKKTVLKYVKKYSKVKDEKTNPGVVFIERLGSKEKKILREFYLRAVSELVTIKDAEKTAKKVGAEIHKFKNGRGIIGALAAVGADLPDRTFEFVAYRKRKIGERKIDSRSVYEMDEATYPDTFNNIDYKLKRILILPHGPDPVYCGIRGESPEIVEKAWKNIRPLEEIERTIIFVTNHGTDAHLRKKKIKEIKPYDCAIIDGTVVDEPIRMHGGHVFFSIKDSSGTIGCAAYKQTGDFREAILKLMPGDRIHAFGGISRYPDTLNLEKIKVLRLATLYEKVVPVCCAKNMKSAGKNKGYKCIKCGRKERKTRLREICRSIKLELYEATAGARRHLSKPLIRIKKKRRKQAA
jgi:tRNA(Ile2)-agmatinylcytidine synthase